MAVLVTQVAIEVLTSNSSKARATQVAVEALTEVSAPVRVTQAGVEVIRSSDEPPLQVTQAGVEVIRTTADPPLQVTQAGIEVVWRPAVTGSFSADALIQKTITSTSTPVLVQAASKHLPIFDNTITLPGSPTVGNLLVFHVWSGTGTWGFPSGFTLQYERTSNPFYAIATRVVQSGDSATWTFGGSHTAQRVYLQEYSGVGSPTGFTHGSAPNTNPVNVSVGDKFAVGIYANDSSYADRLVHIVAPSTEDYAAFADPNGYFPYAAVGHSPYSLDLQADTGTISYQNHQYSVGAYPILGGISVDANIIAIRTGSFSVDALFKRTQTGSFDVSALIQLTSSGSFTLDANIGVHYGDFTLDAVIETGIPDPEWGPWSEIWHNHIAATITGSFDASALVNRTTSGTFSLSADILATRPGSFSLSAVSRATQTGTFTVSAIVSIYVTGSFAASAVIRRTVTGSFTASAVIFRTQTGSLSLDAQIGTPPVLGDFSADAIIFRTQTGSFTVSAVVVATWTGTFGLSAEIVSFVGSFSIDAQVLDTVTGSFAAGAVVRATQSGAFSLSASASFLGTGDFTISAVIQRTVASGISASAVFFGERTGSFGLSSAFRSTITQQISLSAEFVSFVGSFGINATIWATVFRSFPLSAVVWGTRSGDFAISSFVVWTYGGTFGASAVIQRTIGGSFTTDATIKRTIDASFAISAMVRAADVYVTPENGDKIVIVIGERDVARLAIYSKSEFVSQVNGAAGNCRLTLIDRYDDLDIITGQPITLIVNDLTLWTGYVMRVKRVYAFPAYSTDERLIEIDGVDVNILFQKRMVYNKTNVNDIEGPQYPAYTLDTTAIHALVTRYLDLSEDGIDTASQVHSLGTINEDQTAHPLRPSGTWQESMRTIGSWLSPIWYINPDRQLVWADVDVEDAPFVISDNPNAADERGVADLTITKDGTALSNDVLFIGAGNGSDRAVYKRLTDTPSVTSHNLSQYGTFVGGVYKQATIDRIASAYLNGTTTSKRGHKDDKTTVVCTLFQHGIRAGHKVRVVSDVWGFDDVIPVRQMRLRWITPDQPRYELTLTHEIDVWSFFDPFNYHIPLPVDTKIPRTPDPEIPRTDEPQCYDPADCTAIIDGFSNRTVNPTNVGSNIWGQTPGGYNWMNSSLLDAPSGSVMMVETDSGVPVGRITLKSTVSASTGVVVSLNDGSGSSYSPAPPGGNGLPPGLVTNSSVTYLIDFKINDVPKSYLEFGLVEGPANNGDNGVSWFISGVNGTIGIDTYDSVQVSTSFSITNQTWYTGKLSIVGGTAMIKVWQQGTAEPDWMLTRPTGQLPWTPGEFAISAERAKGDTLSSNFYFTNFRMEDPECLGITDTFTRTVASGLGTSDTGTAWTHWTSNGVTNDGMSVNGSTAVFADIYSSGFTAYNEAYLDGIGVTTGAIEFTIRAMWDRLRYSGLDQFSWHFNVRACQVDPGIEITTSAPGPSDSISYSFQPNVWYNFHFKKDSSNNCYASVWPDGSTEPASWMLEGVNNFSIYGEFAISHQSSTSDYPTVGHMYVDDLDIIGVPGGLGETGPGGLPWCGCGEWDSFSRVVASGWGTGDAGQVWSPYEDSGTVSVNGTQGVLSVTASGDAWASANNFPAPDFDMSAQFTIGTIPGTGVSELHWAFWDGAGKIVTFWLTFTGAGSLYIETTDPDYDVAVGYSFASNTTYNIKIAIGATWEIPGGNIKIWPSSEAEPGIWNAATNFAPPMSGSFEVGLASGGSFVVTIDSINFSNYCDEETEPGTQVSGYICEEFPGYSGLSSITVAHQYTNGSVEVYLNGLRQFSFSEAGGSTVTIAFPTISSDVVKVCYVIATGFIDSSPWVGGYTPI